MQHPALLNLQKSFSFLCAPHHRIKFNPGSPLHTRPCMAQPPIQGASGPWHYLCPSFFSNCLFLAQATPPVRSPSSRPPNQGGPPRRSSLPITVELRRGGREPGRGPTSTIRSVVQACHLVAGMGLWFPTLWAPVPAAWAPGSGPCCKHPGSSTPSVACGYTASDSQISRAGGLDF